MDAAPTSSTTPDRDLSTPTVRVEVSADTLRIAARLPWALQALQGLTMGAWVALACTSIGSAGATLAVCVPWMVLTWKRAWRRARRGVIDPIGRALTVTAGAAGDGYRESRAAPSVTLDGRPVDPSQIAGVFLVPVGPSPMRRGEAPAVTPSRCDVYLRLTERVLHVLSAPPELAHGVATQLYERLPLSAPREDGAVRWSRFAFDGRPFAAWQRAAFDLRTGGGAVFPSNFYGGWRVLGACFAVYAVCTLPLAMAAALLPDTSGPLALEDALAALVPFAIADQLAVTTWGSLFRKPMRRYARALFEGVAEP